MSSGDAADVCFPLSSLLLSVSMRKDEWKKKEKRSLGIVEALSPSNNTDGKKKKSGDVSVLKMGSNLTFSFN